MKTIETDPKPTVKESEKLDERVRSLLVIYGAVLHRTMLDIASPVVQDGKINSAIALAATVFGTKKGEVRFVWSDGPVSISSPEIFLVTETGKKYIRVIVSGSHLKELEKEITRNVPDCALPYFFLQADYIATIIKKLDPEKRRCLPVRQSIEITISKIYELYLKI